MQRWAWHSQLARPVDHAAVSATRRSMSQTLTSVPFILLLGGARAVKRACVATAASHRRGADAKGRFMPRRRL
jgi:hypothetical protein